jgi:hypothetical protein
VSDQPDGMARVNISTLQVRLLHWLTLAGEYGRAVWGGELDTARSLAAAGLATLKRYDEDWVATVTPARRVEFQEPIGEWVERWGAGVVIGWCAMCDAGVCSAHNPPIGELPKMRAERDAALQEVERLRSQRTYVSQGGHWCARSEALLASHPKCAVCGKPASCMGAYESDDCWDYSCDECCGHGNEDGSCFPLSEIPARYHGLLTRQAALEEAASSPSAAEIEVTP